MPVQVIATATKGGGSKRQGPARARQALRLGLLFLSLGWGSGLASAPLPYRFTLDHVLDWRGPPPQRTLAFDIEGDGSSEILLVGDFEAQGRSVLRLYRSWRGSGHRATVQFNLPQSWGVAPPVDLDGDGLLELILFEARPDTLSVFSQSPEYEAARRLLFDLPLPGLLAEPSFQAGVAQVCKLPESDEVLFIVNTQYGGLPRVALLYRSGTGILWRRDLPSALHSGGFADTNGDGELDILLGSNSPNNGAHVAGIGGDNRSYLFALGRSGEILDLESPAGLHSTTYHRFAAADGRPVCQVVVAQGSIEDPFHTLVRTKRFDTGELRRLELPDEMTSFQIGDFDSDGRDDIVLGTRQGSLSLFNLDLELVKQWQFDSKPHPRLLHDFTGDGRPELLIGFLGELLLCDSDCRALARLTLPANQPSTRSSLWMQGGDTAGLCLTIASRTELYRIEPITIWEEARNHGFWLGLALGLGLCLLAIPLYWLARRRPRPAVPSAQKIHELFLALSAWHREGLGQVFDKLQAPGAAGDDPEIPGAAAIAEQFRLEYRRRLRPRLLEIDKLYRTVRAPAWPHLQLSARQRDLEDLLKATSTPVEEAALAERLQPIAGEIGRDLHRIEQQLCLVLSQDLVDVCRQVLQGRLLEGGTLDEVNVRFSKETVKPVAFERDALYSVIENMVTNSIQAMDGRRRIDLEFISSRPNRVLLEISDSGCGVSDDIADLIFTEGFSTHGRGRGWGLKLVKDQMARFEGQVRLQSGHGRLGGASFQLEFASALGQIWEEGSRESAKSQKSYTANP